MKKINFFFLAFLLISFFSCKNDDDCQDCNACENVIDETGYEEYEVDFYATHKNFEIKSAFFETVTEQVLVKQEHQEGALFETVTELYLVKESSKRHQILDSMVIHIVANSETDSVAEIACYHFFEETDFVELDVPAEYQTRTIQYVVQQGTGANVPAIYSTITKRIVVSDSEIVATTDDQKFKKVIFRIPDDQTIRGYLANQFAQQSIQECVEENSYKIYD